MERNKIGTTKVSWSRIHAHRTKNICANFHDDFFFSVWTKVVELTNRQSQVAFHCIIAKNITSLFASNKKMCCVPVIYIANQTPLGLMTVHEVNH